MIDARARLALDLPAAPAVDGLSVREIGHTVCLWCMAHPGRAGAWSIEHLELGISHSAAAVASLGGEHADRKQLELLANARRAMLRSIDIQRTIMREAATREGAARASETSTGHAGKGGGARVLRPVGPSTRPPGGMGAIPDLVDDLPALPAAHGAWF